MQRMWEQVLGLVEERVGKTSTDTWLKPLRPLSVDADTFHLEVPSALFRDWLLSHLVGPLEDAFREVRGQATHLVFHVREKLQGELFPVEEQKQAAQAEKQEEAKKNGLVQHYTFASFVVGGSNQFAHAAARAVSTHPGKNYNPLFIYGGVGLGKTHLINAIGHETLVKKGSGRVMYLSSESFTNELIAHLRRNRMAEFKNKFRRADVLILDDVQFLSGRERTQEEFFHTFNALHEANKQIILTSDKFPHEIRGLEERLRNRFEWGLIADIQPPDLETRVAILQKKARTKRISLPDEVALFIAAHVTSNVRELEGGLTRLGALAALNQAKLTVNFAKQALHDLLAAPARDVSIESVQKTVSKYFGIRVADITSKRRTKLITLPRQVAMFLCRKLAASSYPMIGMRFGGKDHTTVLHACHTIETRLKQDEELRDILTRIEIMIAH